MANDPDWDMLDNYAPHFSNWLKKVDELCDHFLSVSVFEFDGQVELHESFQVKVTPEQFVKETMMPLVEDLGCLVDEIIERNAMWGALQGALTR